MQRRWKNTVLFVLATLALAAGLWLNLPAKLSENGVANFDWHSNDIMISDLIYRQNYGTDSLFLQQITPGTLSPEDRSKAEGVQQQVFAQGGSFDRTLFQTYNSNVVVQRYQYAALDALLPVSNGTLLVILQGLNCLLFAAMLAILLNWIRGITGGWIAALTGAALVVVSPYFAMYAKNLYWCAGTLFLPMAAMALLTGSRHFRAAAEKQQYLQLAAVAFVTCLAKQLFCFEFVSTVMVAMTVPTVYWAWSHTQKLSCLIKVLAAQVVGAVASFAVAFGCKAGMLAAEYGAERGLEILFYNLNYRVLGVGETTSAVIQASYDASAITVLAKMLVKDVVDLKGVVQLSAAGLVGLTVFAVGVVCLRDRSAARNDTAWCSLGAATFVALLAPLSWFVLAKPHTYIHSQHSSILWYCPFVLLALPFLMQTGRMLLFGARKPDVEQETG